MKIPAQRCLVSALIVARGSGRVLGLLSAVLGLAVGLNSGLEGGGDSVVLL